MLSIKSTRGKCAREERLCGFSSFPVDFSMDFAPLAFSLSVQTLGGSISLTTFIFTFSALTSKALLSVGLILGAGPSVGNVSAEETFSTATVSDTNDTKEMRQCVAVGLINDLSTNTDRYCTVNGPFVSVFSTGSRFDPHIPLLR